MLYRKCVFCRHWDDGVTLSDQKPYVISILGLKVHPSLWTCISPRASRKSLGHCSGRKKNADLLPSLPFSLVMPLRQYMYIFCTDNFKVSFKFYNSCIFCFHLDLASCLGKPDLIIYICLQQLICSRQRDTVHIL